MPTFVLSLNWTDQGIRAVKDAPKRSGAQRKTSPTSKKAIPTVGTQKRCQLEELANTGGGSRWRALPARAA